MTGPMKTRYQTRRLLELEVAGRKRRHRRRHDESLLPSSESFGAVSRQSKIFIMRKATSKLKTKYRKKDKDFNRNTRKKDIKRKLQICKTQKHGKDTVEKSTQTDVDVITTAECQSILACNGCYAMGYFPAFTADCCNKILYCKNCTKICRKYCPSCYQPLKIVPMPWIREFPELLAQNKRRITRGNYPTSVSSSKMTQTLGEAILRSDLQRLFTCCICWCVVQLPAEVCLVCNKLLGCIQCLNHFRSVSQSDRCPYCQIVMQTQKFPLVAGLTELLKSDAGSDVLPT
ncbi:uncharacterized protein LOC102805033 [Saccoglossus kowalevskii]|uniref:Uncharacterized protein LOC102805033 n=1 Tax=Saccoglossus kowalevskii TaxID=10224 RepID=A0ABM0MWG2_SACKO|nr:PREDICTED: uncharacterized protein LOC102805033 [Saccoglossus kowalevskii]